MLAIILNSSLSWRGIFQPKLFLVLLMVFSTFSIHPGIAQSQTPEVGDPVLVGAGDIAACSLPGDEATAKLIDQIEGTVFTAGDNVYPDGSPEAFETCYGPSWGRFKKRTYASLGNHDYVWPLGQGYFDYFGRRGGPHGLGFYSFDLGKWHIIVLNSNIDARPVESRQAIWLRDDLKTHPAVCTLAIWHHPVFSSRASDNADRMRGLWQILYDRGVDVVINGHIHYYERLAPMNSDGWPDLDRGIREFIVGTGGATLAKDTGKDTHPASEIRDSSTWGVLKLTLHPASYEWAFIPVEGGIFRDEGSAACVESVA
jgi:hypothetical protein